MNTEIIYYRRSRWLAANLRAYPHPHRVSIHGSCTALFSSSLKIFIYQLIFSVFWNFDINKSGVIPQVGDPDADCARQDDLWDLAHQHPEYIAFDTKQRVDNIIVILSSHFPSIISASLILILVECWVGIRDYEQIGLFLDLIGLFLDTANVWLSSRKDGCKLWWHQLW